MVVILSSFLAGCDDDGNGSHAVSLGVGAACDDDEACGEAQACLTEFKGGMCGIADCTASSECPVGSVCVADPDLSRNFCLLTCKSKAECNVHRSVDEEANCSSSLNEVDAPDGGENDPKVCRPPNG
jgi:hypothetical protein